MIRLLRHDPSVLREEDRAVEFRILASTFRSEWLNYLQKGEVPRKYYSIVWIHTLLKPSCTFERFKATLEEKLEHIAGQRVVTGRLRRARLPRWKLPR